MSGHFVVGMLLLAVIPFVAVPNTTVKQHLTICGILFLSVTLITASTMIAK